MRIPTVIKDFRNFKDRFRRRGFRQDPKLELKKGADVTFVKPLPDGRRLHIRIWRKRDHYLTEVHIDRKDPRRNPIGHLIYDVILGDIEHKYHKTKRIGKREKKKITRLPKRNKSNTSKSRRKISRTRRR